MASLSRKMRPHCARIRKERVKQHFCELCNMFSNIGGECKNYKCLQKGNGLNIIKDTTIQKQSKTQSFKFPGFLFLLRLWGTVFITLILERQARQRWMSWADRSTLLLYSCFLNLEWKHITSRVFKRARGDNRVYPTQEPSTLKSLHFSISIIVFKSSLQQIPFFL